MPPGDVCSDPLHPIIEMCHSPPIQQAASLAAPVRTTFVRVLSFLGDSLHDPLKHMTPRADELRLSGLEHIRPAGTLGMAIGANDGGRARDSYRIAEVISGDSVGAFQFRQPASSRSPCW